MKKTPSSKLNIRKAFGYFLVSLPFSMVTMVAWKVIGGWWAVTLLFATLLMVVCIAVGLGFVED